MAYEESVVLRRYLESITINFEQGDSDIEIIGTYVVPEFNAAIIILVVGIMTTILVVKNKFQIKI